MAKRMGSTGKGFLNIGNKVHIHPDSLPKMTFDDVAGVEEAKLELKEGVDFLKDRMAQAPKSTVLIIHIRWPTACMAHHRMIRTSMS